MVHVMAMAAALALYRDINSERAEHGLPTLLLDARLVRAADEHAQEMAQAAYFAHDSMNGQTPFDRMRDAGCTCSYAGENIAEAQDAEQADAALFESLPHRENTLSGDYRRIGIGVAQNSDGDMIFVEDFSS